METTPIRRLRALVLLTALCAATSSVSQAAVFEPTQNDHTVCIYSNGRAIAVAQGDSAYLWLVLEPGNVVGRSYLQLWCMYQNLRSEPVLFEPQTSCVIEIQPRAESPRATIRPESPAYLLKSISAAKNANMFAAAIGGALLSASSASNVRPTTISGTGAAIGTGYVVNDAREKARAEARDIGATTGSIMGAIGRSYDVFKSSVADGVLRKNTLFPGSAVNGYLYFPRYENYAWRKQLESEDKDPWPKDKWPRVQTGKVRTVEQALRYPERNAFKVFFTAMSDTFEVVFNPKTDE